MTLLPTGRSRVIKIFLVDPSRRQATPGVRYCCVQSFTSLVLPEITRHDDSVLLVRATYIWVLFFEHIPFVVNRTFNVTPTERLQQHPLLFTTKRTDRTFFLWSLHLARPSHPGHSTILLPCLALQTYKLNRWIWFTLSKAKALLRLAAAWDTKQAGDLRGDTVQFIALNSCVASSSFEPVLLTTAWPH